MITTIYLHVPWGGSEGLKLIKTKKMKKYWRREYLPVCLSLCSCCASATTSSSKILSENRRIQMEAKRITRSTSSTWLLSKSEDCSRWWTKKPASSSCLSRTSSMKWWVCPAEKIKLPFAIRPFSKISAIWLTSSKTLQTKRPLGSTSKAVFLDSMNCIKNAFSLCLMSWREILHSSTSPS